MKLTTSSLLTMAMMYGMNDMIAQDELYGIDIKVEYDLIQRKQFVGKTAKNNS